MSFKHIKIAEQLRQSQGEINRLKSIVGEFPHPENDEANDRPENEEVKTIANRIVSAEETIDAIFGGV